MMTVQEATMPFATHEHTSVLHEDEPNDLGHRISAFTLPRKSTISPDHTA
jgi:hypothetical protein